MNKGIVLKNVDDNGKKFRFINISIEHTTFLTMVARKLYIKQLNLILKFVNKYLLQYLYVHFFKSITRD